MTIVLDREPREQVEAELKALKEAADEVKKSPEAFREFLLKCGFITPEGQLHENYR